MERVIVTAFVIAVFSGCSPSPRYTIHQFPPKEPPSKESSGIDKDSSTVKDSGTAGGSGTDKASESADGIKAGEEKPPKGKTFRGMASYYGPKFNGRKTANGEVFDMHGLTCAHKTLPFNTWLEVKNLANGRTVIVRVNDRGPFVGNRVIDLSQGAAKEIHMIEAGVQEIEFTVIR